MDHTNNDSASSSALPSRSENAEGSTNSQGVDDPASGGPPPTRRRWVVAAMAALAVMLFAVPFLRGPREDAGSTAAFSSADSTCSAGTANFDFTMKDMNGADVRLGDYKGKVVLLNFWATWCGPCKVEIPEFVEVYSEYRDRGFEILGVLSMDEPSTADLQAFADTYKMNYPVLRANEEFENAYGPLFGLPTTFLIDRTGAICRKHMGPVSRKTIEQEISGLL
jgi:peroxiredoxin